MRRYILTLLVIITTDFLLAQVPNTTSFQGSITDSEGAIVQDGNYNLHFKIFNSATDGTMLWEEARVVSTSGGVFSTILGTVNEIDLPFNTQYWLEMSIEGGTPLSPRIGLTSSFYSLMSKSVEDSSITTDKLKNNSVTSNKISDNSITTDDILPDLVASINGVSNDGGNVDLLAGANVSIVPNNETNSVTISAENGAGDNLGNHVATQDLRFQDDISTIKFANANLNNQPMMEMFSSGTTNATRMFVAHSSSFPRWGIEYNDTSDAFTFAGAGVPVLFVQLAGSQRVGIGTNTPLGKLDVDGSIYQRGGILHADYVFEDDYQLESIKEHTEFMWREKHLSAIPKAKVDENGNEIVEVGSHRRGIVEELEKAHIYISQLEERLSKLEQIIMNRN